MRAPSRLLTSGLARCGPILALLLLARPGVGQEARIRTQADTSLMSVGDRLTLTLEVEHTPSQRVLWPDSVDVAPFEVLGAQAAPPVTEGDRVRSAMRLTLTVFELGNLEIPGIRVPVASADGSVDTLVSDGWRVTVSSVGLDEGGDIRDIRGPLSIPFGVVTLVPWLALAAFLIALAVWWWRRRSKRGPTPEAAPPPAPRRPPYEIALEALARLEASDLLQRGEVKEYHVRVSEIVRAYVEAFYRVPALEMTTREVLLGLDRVGVHGPPIDHLGAFLDRCDLVKFAKLRPSSEATRAMLALARAFVEETRPRIGEDADVESEGPGTGAPGPEAEAISTGDDPTGASP
jgi:hypothetical protein